MESIRDLFNNKEFNFREVKSKKRSERGDLIDYFFQKQIKDKKGKPLSRSTLGYFMSVYKTGDLYALRLKCEKSRNFEATWWSHVKPKKK